MLTPKEEKPLESKFFDVKSEKNTEYKILLQNTGSILNISTEIKTKNSLHKTIYQNKFTLIDIQKFRFFKGYDTIDECLSEIEINKGIIKEKENSLDLVIPLNSKKYPEIVFPLLIKNISDSEKIQELYDVIENLSNENKRFQKQIEELQKMLYHEINIITKKDEPDGISSDLFCFGKEDYDNYIDKNKDIKNNQLFQFIFNLKNNNKLNEIKNIINEDKNKNNIINIEILKDNRISFYGLIPYNITNEELKEVDFVRSVLGINHLKNMRLIFKTDLTIRELCEIKKFSKFFDKITNCHLFIKNITSEFKTVLINLLNIIDSFLTKDKYYENQIKKEILVIKIILSWRESFIPEAKKLFEDIKSFLNEKFEEKNLDEFISKIPLMINLINQFLDVRIKKVMEMIDLNNFSFILPIYMLNVGFYLKANIKELNEVMKNKIIQN